MGGKWKPALASATAVVTIGAGAGVVLHSTGMVKLACVPPAGTVASAGRRLLHLAPGGILCVTAR